jgi:hypothetical protein
MKFLLATIAVLALAIPASAAPKANGHNGTVKTVEQTCLTEMGPVQIEDEGFSGAKFQAQRHSNCLINR